MKEKLTNVLKRIAKAFCSLIKHIFLAFITPFIFSVFLVSGYVYYYEKAFFNDAYFGGITFFFITFSLIKFILFCREEAEDYRVMKEVERIKKYL